MDRHAANVRLRLQAVPMIQVLYPLRPFDPPDCEFLALREARDVIKIGPVKMWFSGPGAGCPVQDNFYRRIGLRVFNRQS